MIVKYLIVIIALLSFTLLSNGQNKLSRSHLSNDSVKFNIFRTQPDWDKDQFYSETIIQIRSIDSIDLKIIESLQKKDWIDLLSDGNYDWVANLALYQLYRKDASVFRVVNDRSKWIGKRKDDDLVYWQKNLK